MLTLLLMAIVGFVFSLILHVCTLLDVYQPPDQLVIAQNVGIGILFIAIGVILRRARRGLDEHFYKKHLLNISPEWMKPVVGFFTVYGVVVFAVFLHGAFASASARAGVEITLSKFHKGLSALLMVFYVVEVSILYSLRVLLKSHVKYCSNDHKVPMLSTHCGVCGMELK